MRETIRVTKDVKSTILNEAKRRGISVDDCVMLFAKKSAGCGTPHYSPAKNFSRRRAQGVPHPELKKIKIELVFARD